MHEQRPTFDFDEMPAPPAHLTHDALAKGFDEHAASLLDEAESIVNAVAPEILAEVRKQDQRRGLGGWLDKIKRRR